MTEGERTARGNVLEVPAPRFIAAEAETVIRQAWGIRGEAHPLDSERDQNFLLESPDGERFVLKVANSAEEPGVLDLQTAALQYLEQLDPGIPAPRVILTGQGATRTSIEHRGSSHWVRLLSYLPGSPLGHRPSTPRLRRELGFTLARLARAWRGFFHPAAGHRLLWDLKRAGEVRSRLETVGDAPQRRVLEQCFERFDSEVFPHLRGLRAQVIHGDLNPGNLLVSDGDPNIVTGVIDFGDLVHSCQINDPAVALAYQLYDSEPVAAACDLVSAYNSALPLEEEEIVLLFDLVRTRLAVSVTIANWRASEQAANREYILGDTSRNWKLLQHLVELDPDSVSRRFRRACGFPERHAVASGAVDDLKSRRRSLLGPSYSLFYDEPLHIVRGEGVWLYDSSGRQFLDAYNNVACVGHCHPLVVAALSGQAKTLNTNTRYLHESILDYAERLLAILPSDLDTCLFVCTGSEANDLALQLARTYTGGWGAIITSHSYHGNTAAVVQLSASEVPPERREGWVAIVPAPNSYSEHYRGLSAEQQVGELSGVHADSAIEQLRQRDIRPAALFVDTIFSCDGILTPPGAYLGALFERVRAAGGICVADEVQAGFGRTGTHLWGFERHGVIPDIVTLGKPMGNGHPLAAVVTRREIVQAFASRQEYFNTFAGNPVSCSVGLAVLEVLRREKLMENADSVGAYLRGELEDLAQDFPCIGEVRGAGLYVGVEIVTERQTREPDAEKAHRVVNALRQNGVLISRTGPRGNVLKIRPPLVFSRPNADLLLQVLRDALRIDEPSQTPG